MSSASPSPTLLVPERARRVDFLWGFLSIVFGVALVRGHLGMRGTGRVAIDVVFGILFAGSLFAWLWFRRHPASLEVRPDAIVFSHRGQRGRATLERTTGEVYVKTTFVGGKYRVDFLKGPRLEGGGAAPDVRSPRARGGVRRERVALRPAAARVALAAGAAPGDT